MALRKINPNISIPSLDNKTNQNKQWQSIALRLVTPMHGGGSSARKSDEKYSVRVTSIRGQLRRWWRLLAQYKWKLSEIRAEEFALWGGMGSNDDSYASTVFIKVTAIKGFNEELYNEDGYSSGLKYILFTAKKMKLCKPGLSWRLQWCLNADADIYWHKNKQGERMGFNQERYDEHKQQVQETLRWWITFGGLGGRTQRGCGTVYTDNLPTISVEEAKAVGCHFLFQGNPQTSSKINSAWEDSASQWQELRRNKKPLFKKLLGKDNEHSRRLNAVLSRPLCIAHDDGGKWQGVIVLLPNACKELREIFKGETKL